MKSTFSYIKLILSNFLILIVFASCHRENVKPAIDIRQLMSKHWELAYVQEDTYHDSASAPTSAILIGIPACQEGDVLEFQDNHVFIRHNQLNQCQGEAAVEKSSWMIKKT